MNSENFQRLRKELEPILPEIFSNSVVSELLQDGSIPESEAVRSKLLQDGSIPESEAVKSELLQDGSIPESEAVKVELTVLEVKVQIKISLPKEQFLTKCVGYYKYCPYGQHRYGNCEHLVDC